MTHPAQPPESRTAESAARRTRSRARVRYNAAMKLVRRTHLFIGLFLTPWVFLYGVTAFLFNHPGAFPDREVRRASPDQIAGTGVEAFPTASQLAPRVIDALNAREDGGPFRLVKRGRAAYSRRLFVTATGGGREHSVRVDPDSGEVFIRSSDSVNLRSSSETRQVALALDDAPRDRLAEGIPTLLGRLHLPADSVAIRNPPDLVCTAEAGGRPYRVAYNLATEATSIRPLDDPGARLSSRRFLTGLHLAFGYPAGADVRWFWALVVDAMGVAMVLWGLSGLLMWWQMRSLRRWGAAVLFASVAGAAALAFGMHGVLAR